MSQSRTLTLVPVALLAAVGFMALLAVLPHEPLTISAPSINAAQPALASLTDSPANGETKIASGAASVLIRTNSGLTGKSCNILYQLKWPPADRNTSSGEYQHTYTKDGGPCTTGDIVDGFFKFLTAFIKAVKDKTITITPAELEMLKPAIEAAKAFVQTLLSP